MFVLGKHGALIEPAFKGGFFPEWDGPFVETLAVQHRQHPEGDRIVLNRFQRSSAISRTSAPVTFTGTTPTAASGSAKLSCRRAARTPSFAGNLETSSLGNVRLGRMPLSQIYFLIGHFELSPLLCQTKFFSYKPDLMRLHQR